MCAQYASREAPTSIVANVKCKLLLPRDRALARVASGGSGHAAGVGSIPGIDLRLSPGLAPRIKSTASSRVGPQMDRNVPVAYETTMVTMVSVISRRTRSSTLCVIVSLVVHVWCECGVCGCVHVCARIDATTVSR
jgi:hypothetical protein